MSDIDRNKLRELQDKVLETGKRLSLQTDQPISSEQYGAPTLDDLSKGIFPGFEPSMCSFLEHFNQL